MKRLLALVCLLVAISHAYAETITFNYADHFSKLDSRGGEYGETELIQTGLALTVFGATVSHQAPSQSLKFQKNTGLVIEGGNITKITITQIEKSRTFNASTDTVTQDQYTVTWTGNTSKLTLTNPGSSEGNINVMAITIEYTPSNIDYTKFYNSDTWGTTSAQLSATTGSEGSATTGWGGSGSYYHYIGTAGNGLSFGGIDVVKDSRLSFNLPSGSFMGIDFGLHHIYVNRNVGIVFNNLKRGDKVMVTALGDGASIQGTNTTVSSYPLTNAMAEYSFEASNDGDVTLTFPKPTYIKRLKTSLIPKVVATTPTAQATGVSISIATIDLEFDYAITPIVGAKIYATAVGGNNEVAAGELSYQEGSAAVSVDPNNSKKLRLKVDNGTLKKDVSYTVYLPAGSVRSEDGSTNEPYSYTFTMKKGTVSHTISYPYTWDFENLSSELVNALTINSRKPKTNTTKQWMVNINQPGQDQEQYNDNAPINYFGNYVGDNDQGILYKYQGGELEKVENYTNKEMFGLRISLARPFGSGRKRIQLHIREKNQRLALQGNTHFLTIPNVPKGKLYIRARVSDFLNVNSSNAVFVKNGSENIANSTSQGKTVYVLDVKQAGDVVLATGDVILYQIAVPATTKKFLSRFEGYATDCQPHTIRYDLTEKLSDTPVAASIVKSIGSDNTMANATTVVCSPANTGTILKATLADNKDAELPLFVNDVNTTADNVSGNKLIGVLAPTSIGSTASEGNYIFTNIFYQLDEQDKNKVNLQQQHNVSMGFYNTVSGTIGANKSYLKAGNGTPAKKSYLLFNFMPQTLGIDQAATGNTAASSNWPAAYYTLQGIKVDNPTQGGIYIYKGKKVIIK